MERTLLFILICFSFVASAYSQKSQCRNLSQIIDAMEYNRPEFIRPDSLTSNGIKLQTEKGVITISRETAEKSSEFDSLANIYENLKLIDDQIFFKFKAIYIIDTFSFFSKKCSAFNNRRYYYSKTDKKYNEDTLCLKLASISHRTLKRKHLTYIIFQINKSTKYVFCKFNQVDNDKLKLYAIEIGTYE